MTAPASSGSIPTVDATVRAVARLSPVSSTGLRPSSRRAATASALVGFTASATTSTATARPSRRRRSPCARRPPRSSRPGQRARQDDAPVGEEGGTSRHDGVPLHHALHPEAGSVAERIDGWEGAGALSRRGRDGAADGVLAGRFERAHESQGVVASTPSTTVRSTRVMRPVVTVPVLSRTMVSTACVASSTSGPLMSTPSWAPRPVPTSSAVGVASPSAQGHAMISTATAAVKASWRGGRSASQAASVTTASTSTIGTKIAETRSASRCTRALPDWASSTSRAMRARAVSAPYARRADDEPVTGVDRCTRDGVARPDLDGRGLAREHRRVDRRGPILDDAVRGDLLAGADDEPHARA